MAQKKDQKSSGPKKSQHKPGGKKARKALARAETSVQAARKAVRASSKKLRKKVSALSAQIEQLATQHADALQQLEIATKRANAQRPSGKEESAAEAATLTPPLPSPQPPAPTLIQLRQRAREQKVAGYSRLNKAGLIAALDSMPQE